MAKPSAKRATAKAPTGRKRRADRAAAHIKKAKHRDNQGVVSTDPVKAVAPANEEPTSLASLGYLVACYYD